MSTEPLRLSNPSALRPMRLLRIPEPFDHPDFLYEVKFDGFRALAHVNGHHCQLLSRNGHVYQSSPYLAEEIAHVVRARSAILDGELRVSHRMDRAASTTCSTGATGRTSWRSMRCSSMAKTCPTCDSTLP